MFIKYTSISLFVFMHLLQDKGIFVIELRRGEREYESNIPYLRYVQRALWNQLREGRRRKWVSFQLSRMPDRALIQEAVLYVAGTYVSEILFVSGHNGQEIVVRAGGIQRVTPQVTGIWASHSVGTARIASLFPCRILMNPYFSWILGYANLEIDARDSNEMRDWLFLHHLTWSNAANLMKLLKI